MIRGTVIWFRSRIGYGFIEHTDGRQVFVHWSKVDPEVAGHYKKLHDGQEVEYEVEEKPNGDLAATIVKTLPYDPNRRTAVRSGNVRFPNENGYSPGDEQEQCPSLRGGR